MDRLFCGVELFYYVSSNLGYFFVCSIVGKRGIACRGRLGVGF